MNDQARTVSPLIAGVNRALVWLRYPIVFGWLVVAVAAVVYLPALGGPGGEDLPLPDDAAPLAAEEQATQTFGFPLIARTQVIVRDPDGLSATEQAELAEFALAVSRGEIEGLEEIIAVVPLTNAAGAAPGAAESGTAVLSYLLIEPSASIPQQVRLAEAFVAAAPVPEGARTGVTGSTPARDQQLGTVRDRLGLVILLTLLLIIIVIAVVLGSLVAPLIVLGVVAISWVVAMRAIGWVGEATGVSANEDVEPIVSALLIGIVTDYAIFYLFGTRARLREASDAAGRRLAAAAAGAHYMAIVLTAGVTTALGTAALLVGRLDFFRAFAPALALTALVAVIVSVTILPALLALLGRAAYWPRGVGEASASSSVGSTPVAAREPEAGRSPLGARLLATRGVAAATALVVTAGLGLAAWQVTDLRLGLGLTTGISEASQEADAAFAPGYRAPIELLLEGGGATDEEALSELGSLLDERADFVGIIGPGGPAADLLEGAFVSEGADAARFLLMSRQQPTEHAAIGAIADLEDALPGLLERAGMDGVEASLAGDTAIARASVDAIADELLRVGLVALVVNLLLLVIFLRALVAPLYLLLANVLSVGATLGLATLVFQDWLGQGQLVYYVPFAAAVLLLALGSDYNIYLMGQIWRLARGSGLAAGVRHAIPRGSQPIAVAGIVLAGSFGLLALIPVEAMRQFAFVMGVGALLDAFIVRTLLVPSLVTVFGGAGYWPRRPPERTGNGRGGGGPVTENPPR